MPIGPKAIVAAAVIVGAAVAFSGGDANASTRDPWTKPISPPHGPNEMQAARQTMCACFRGGARSVEELTVCSLKQVYGADAPWTELVTPVEGDDPSLAKVVTLFREMAATLLALPESQHPAWCGDNEPIPGVIVDPPPPPADPKEQIRTMWKSLKSDEAMPGRIYIVQKDRDAGGLEQLAKRALENAGADLHATGSYNKLVKPLMVALARGPRWNRRLYGKTAVHNTNTDERWYSYQGENIKPAWLPRNEDANAKVIAGEAPARNIFADGSKKGAGSSFGAVFVPKFNVEIARDEGVFVVDDEADYDPPDTFLDLLGM